MLTFQLHLVVLYDYVISHFIRKSIGCQRCTRSQSLSYPSKGYLYRCVVLHWLPHPRYMPKASRVWRINFRFLQWQEKSSKHGFNISEDLHLKMQHEHRIIYSIIKGSRKREKYKKTLTQNQTRYRTYSSISLLIKMMMFMFLMPNHHPISNF